MNIRLSNFLTLAGFIIFVLFIGWLSSFFSGSALIKTIYLSLNKPVFAPPTWVFGLAWTILYILIAISAYFVWTKRQEKNINPAVAIFFVQLFLNYAWSIIFFGKGSFTLAFVDIIALWISIWAMIMVFSRTSKLAAWLLVPYLLWVSFASVLNYYVIVLN
jgi:tryptophan-rich sensory protein